MENFNKLINEEKPVLVDFYATWCGPCKTLAPVLEEIQEEFKNELNVIKIDVDENPELAAQFHIKSVPTLMVFKEGNILNLMKGFMGKQKILEMLNIKN